MNENDLISRFSQFGYYIMKHGTHYSIFDRRSARRISELDSLEALANHAQNVFMFDFWSETLERTVAAFRDILSTSPVTSPKTLPAETVTGEKKNSEPEPEQEQEETTAPVSPETEQKDNPEKDSPVLYTKTCKGCGKEFQTAHKQSMYCSPACYPSNKEKQSQSPESPSKPVAVQRPF